MADLSEIELYFDGATAVSLVDAAGYVPGSAECKLYSPTGDLICSASIDIPDVSTTIDNPIDAGMLQVADVSGFAAGDAVCVESNGRRFVAEIDHIDDDVLLLSQPLRLVPAVNSTVQVCRLTASVPAPGAGYIAKPCRLVWTYTAGGQPRRVGIPAMVVRWQWTPVVTPAYVAERYGIMLGETPDASEAERVARCANELIRTAINLTGRRPELYISSGVFASVAESAVSYQMAKDGKCLGGDIFAAQRELRFQFEDGMTRIISSATTAYDSDANGKLQGEELQRSSFTIQVIR